ncbi:MAG: hypothetical protein KDD10_23380 [Phaeodactylibacter sp.]|nr:hypothetical protein [Phaeodactylibacter sp.]
MLIDWFTVIAQLINFLILVWLLKRFLYQPILRAMDERQKHITEQLEQADAQKARAEAEESHFQQMSSELAEQRETLIQKARAEAEAERRRLMEAAREDHRQLRLRLRQTLESERANLNQDIIRRFQGEAFGLARKVLADLADSTLEEQMAAVFVRRLEGLPDVERKRLVAALQESNHSLLVRSSFPLSPEQQKNIETAVKRVLAPGGQVAFKTLSGPAEGGQAGGIELTTDGYKLAWSATDYLDTLEKRVAAILEEEMDKAY